ncbi:MAG: hypothetical protein ACXVFN_06775 [Solirubrobacteraceae bacterium]
MRPPSRVLGRVLHRSGTWLATRSGSGFILLGFAGLALGLAIVFFEPIAHWAGGLVGADLSRPFTGSEQQYVRREQTLLWLLLLAGQSAIWAVLLVPIAGTLLQLTPRPRGGLVYGAALVVPVLASSVFADTFLHHKWTLPGHSIKVAVLTGLALVVAAVAAVGVGWVAAGIEDVAREETSWSRRVTTHLELRGALDRLVLCMGVIVGAAILATGALRNATISWSRVQHSALPPDQIFPPEQVLLAGVYFTGLLALLAIPNYERLRSAGGRLRDEQFPVRWPPEPGWKERLDERRAVDGLLKLELSPAASFRAAVAILAPLASSLVSRVLG